MRHTEKHQPSTLILGTNNEYFIWISIIMCVWHVWTVEYSFGNSNSQKVRCCNASILRISIKYKV